MNWIIAILIILSIVIWKASKSLGPKMLIGRTCAVYFMILAGADFWYGDFLRSSKPLFFIGIGLAIVGLLGFFKWSDEPHIESRLRIFEKMFAENIVVLGVGLTATSAIIRAIHFLLG